MWIQKCSRYDPCKLLLQVSQNNHDRFKKNGLEDILINSRSETTINLNSLLDKSVMLVANWIDWEMTKPMTFFRLERWSLSFRSDTHLIPVRFSNDRCIGNYQQYIDVFYNQDNACFCLFSFLVPQFFLPFHSWKTI
jgi:hypothetical protein